MTTPRSRLQNPINRVNTTPGASRMPPEAQSNMQTSEQVRWKRRQWRRNGATAGDHGLDATGPQRQAHGGQLLAAGQSRLRPLLHETNLGAINNQHRPATTACGRVIYGHVEAQQPRGQAGPLFGAAHDGLTSSEQSAETTPLREEPLQEQVSFASSTPSSSQMELNSNVIQCCQSPDTYRSISEHLRPEKLDRRCSSSSSSSCCCCCCCYRRSSRTQAPATGSHKSDQIVVGVKRRHGRPTGGLVGAIIVAMLAICLQQTISYLGGKTINQHKGAVILMASAYQLTNNLIANNLPPKFVSLANGQSSANQQSSEIVVRVKEGAQSIGKLICTLRAEDPDEDPVTFGVLGSMASELLRIENVAGNQANVYLKKELDRETTESHQVVITLTDGKLGRGNWITKSMLIIVEDVNDNYPVFGPHRTAISIREDAKPGQLIETIEATDADEGRFGQVIYKLDELAEESIGAGSASGAGQSTVANTFAIDTLDGRGLISLIGPLDYEQRPLYQLRILAVDRAAESERLSTATTILISVEDCEDQPPMFTFAPSITRIAESLPVGSPILRVAAIDGDRGVNNPIKYTIQSVNGRDSGQERNLFTINSDTGQISVAHPLDREQSSLNPDEPASSGAGSLGDWLTSALTLGAGSSAAASRQSGSAAYQQPGAYVLQVRASEVSSSGSGLFLSSEASVSTELTIILTDVNDESPHFDQAAYLGELLENSPAESLVSFVAPSGGGPVSSSPASAGDSQPAAGQQLQAAPAARVFDRDQGTNGSFSLHLEGPHAHLFDIWPREATNEATLMIKVSKAAYAAAPSQRLLDYEQTKELQLVLVARERVSSSAGDSAHELREARATMTIQLKDANDNYPQFDSELYRVEMPENAIRGMHVCAVRATDSDSGPFGSQGVRYTEIRGERANKFKLDPQTGVITLKTNEHGFDRETIGQHHLIVEARDNLGQGNRNTTQLLIVLTDANDQRPKFLLNQYEAFIYENEPDFASPLQVQAVDNDAAQSMNSRIVYSIIGGDPQQNFTIDPLTGRIRVRTGGLHLSQHQPLAAAAATTTAPARSQDDEPSFDSLAPSLGPTDQPGSGADSMVNQSHQQQVVGLDFERIAQKRDDSRQFNLTIKATDSGLPEALWDTTQVLIMVYDKNDHAPVFTKSVYSRSIREDAKEASQVLQVLALDGDHSPINSKITYRISSGASDKFAIDSDTGLISVAHGANLDIDQMLIQPTDQHQQIRKRTNYLLNVQAFDGSFGPNQKSASCLVNITILDVNNKAPEFVSLGVASSNGFLGPGASNKQQQQQVLPSSLSSGGAASSTVSISEDAPYGLIVTRVMALDLDSNAELRYSINWARSEARNEDMAVVEPALYRDCFAIDAHDGTIKVTKQLDRELFDQIKLRLQVEDIAAQTADQVASAHLLIKIGDINDNRPTFKRPLYRAVVNENSISGTSVITLSADDRDLNKTLRYSLEAQSAELMRLVRINPRSGEITVNDKIDRELYPMINLTVKAEDVGYPHPLFGSAQLQITVRDENDNNPIFLSSPTAGHQFTVSPRAQQSDQQPFGASNQHQGHNQSTNGHRMRSLSAGVPRTAGSYSLADNNHSGGHAASAAAGGEQPSDVALPLLAPGSTAQVSEDAPVGQQIAFVRAEDADLGNNGRVTYLLDANSSQGKFRIDRDLGIISVAQPLDRESQRQFTLIIEACDNYDLGYSTGESRRAFTQVMIQVTDINDNAPTISTSLQQTSASSSSDPQQAHLRHRLQTPTLAAGNSYPTFDEAMNSQGPYELALDECLFINEFQPLNEPILTLTGTDLDDPDTPNGQMDLAIINNLPQNVLFALVDSSGPGYGSASTSPPTPPQSYTSTLVRPPGQDDDDEAASDATTTDSSSSTMMRSTSGRNRPASLVADLSGFGDLVVGGESAIEGHILGRNKRSAEHYAAGFNYYNPTASRGSGSSFSLHGSDGQRHQLSPVAVGRALGGAASEPTGAPATTFSPLIPTVNGRPQSGHAIGQRQAHLVVAQSLKERVGNYTILVRATDRGHQPTGPLSSVKMINVCVQDVNNHSPVFVRPPLNHTIRIMENSTLGSYVAQVEATDLDHGSNGQVHYFLKPTNLPNANLDWQSFKIDRLTGVISTARPFNRQVKKYFTLRIQAQDLGRPTSLSSDIDLNIMIVNSGQYKPEFESQLQQLQFTENLAPGMEWFSLVQTNNLDDDPALINANRLLQQQQQQQQQPTPGPTATTSDSLASSFPSGPSNYVLASPCYYIIDGDDQEQMFQLDRYSHRLSSQKVLDREQKANYTLIVEASNNCSKSPLEAANYRQKRSLATNPFVAATGDSQVSNQSAASNLLQQHQNFDSLLANDKSLLRVVIKVKDVNDNAPRFTQRVYTGGITTEADFGTVFMIAQAVDSDAEANGQLTYSIIKPIRQHLTLAGNTIGSQVSIRQTNTSRVGAPGPQVRPRQKRASPATVGPTTTTIASSGDSGGVTTVAYGENTNNNNHIDSSSGWNDDLSSPDGDLFVINPTTGEISLNFDPQKHMKGYFEFEILARDVDQLSDRAKVFIYLLRQDQRIKFVLRLTPQELRQRLNKFRSVFGNITGAIVNIDSYKYYENHDGTVDKKKTSLFLHFVQPEDNTIIDVNKVLTLIDNNIEYLDELYKEFHVLSSEAAQLQLSASGSALVDPIDQVRTGLFGVTLFLALILVVVIGLCLNQRTRYERQIKAATVSAFGSSPLHIEPDFHSQSNLPNTNLHSQDPNPIWAQNYHHSDQLDWLGGGGAPAAGSSNHKGPADSVGQHQARARPGSRSGPGLVAAAHNGPTRRTSGGPKQAPHSASSGLGLTTLEDVDDDDDDGQVSSSGQSVDLNSLGGLNSVTQLHFNGNTATATPRDSLNSSHGHVSSSGSGSASTTNERQALCSGRAGAGQQVGQANGSASATSARHQAPNEQANHKRLANGRAHPLGPETGHLTTGSSTFGAMKEVTIYTTDSSLKQHQQHMATYAQSNKATTNRPAANNGQRITTGPPPPPPPPIKGAQMAIHSMQTNNGTIARPAKPDQPARNQQHQRILVHANGADVNQGIIRQPKSQVLSDKLVPANQHQYIQQQSQHLQQNSNHVHNFETSLSKLSILNLETTEL